MADHTEPRITLHSHFRRGRTLLGYPVISDTCNAPELRERRYPYRQYFSTENMFRSQITVSSTVKYCPFKGDPNYYLLPEIADAGWIYERSIKKVRVIAGRMAKVAELVK